MAGSTTMISFEPMARIAVHGATRKKTVAKHDDSIVTRIYTLGPDLLVLVCNTDTKFVLKSHAAMV